MKEKTGQTTKGILGRFRDYRIEFLSKNADLLLLLGLGVFLRLREILKYDLWYDEAFTGLLMRVPPEEFAEIVAADPHPPFFALLMRVWTSLVGVSDFSLRFLPFLFGMAGVIMIYAVTKELFGKKAAVISTFLAVINPIWISYSIEARSYSLFVFLILITFYFLIKRRYLLFGICLVLVLNIHYMGLLFLPGLAIAFLADRKLRGKLKVLQDLAVLLPAGVMASYILLRSYGQREVLNIDWALPTTFLRIPRSFTAYLYGVLAKATGTDALNKWKLPVGVAYIGFGLFAVFLVAGILWAIQASREKRWKIGMVGLNLFLPQILMISYGLLKRENLYVERYLLPASAFMLILLGGMLIEMLRFESMSVILVLYLLTLVQIEKPNYNAGMKPLKKDLLVGKEQIVFTGPIDYVIGKYYLWEERERVKILNPREPDLDYAWWPFIEREDKAESLSKSLVVIARGNYVPENLKLLSARKEYSSYRVYREISGGISGTKR